MISWFRIKDIYCLESSVNDGLRKEI